MDSPLAHLGRKATPGWGLQADKQKANEAAAIEESVADERRRQQQAQENAAQQQRNYEILIGDKAAALPEEPPANDPDAVKVMVRMPNGSRIGRRCSPHPHAASLASSPRSWALGYCSGRSCNVYVLS